MDQIMETVFEIQPFSRHLVVVRRVAEAAVAARVRVAKSRGSIA
jgi:hypothetical protein